MEGRAVPGSMDLRPVVPPSAEPRLVNPPLPALMLEARELRRRMLVSAAAASTCAHEDRTQDLSSND